MKLRAYNHGCCISRLMFHRGSADCQTGSPDPQAGLQSRLEPARYQQHWQGSLRRPKAARRCKPLWSPNGASNHGPSHASLVLSIGLLCRSKYVGSSQLRGPFCARRHLAPSKPYCRWRLLHKPSNSSKKQPKQAIWAGSVSGMAARRHSQVRRQARRSSTGSMSVATLASLRSFVPGLPVNQKECVLVE